MATLANLAQGLKRRSRFRSDYLPAAFLLTDSIRLANPEDAIKKLPRGAGVIFRHYGETDRELLGSRLRRLCRAHGILFLVAGDIRLAARLGADGVHLPEAFAHRARAAKRYRHGWIVTTAAHGAAALHRAADSGADAALLSPIFATASHPGIRPIGPARFARLCSASGIPVYALGGVSVATMRRLKDSGAAGIAAISGLASVNHPPSSMPR